MDTELIDEEMTAVSAINMKSSPPGTPKRRRSEGNVDEADQDKLRHIIQEELKAVLQDTLLPSISSHVEHRFSAVQSAQEQITESANIALGKIQTAYALLEQNQSGIAQTAHQEAQRAKDRDKSLEILHAYQQKIDAQMTHLRGLQAEHDAFAKLLALDIHQKFEVADTAYCKQQDLPGSIPIDTSGFPPTSSTFIGADARNLRANLLSSPAQNEAS